MASILGGIRVLDLSQAWSGPFCTLILADFGAEVIKVEPCGVGDASRSVLPFVNGLAYNTLLVNRSKKSITLDIRTKKGKEILRKLVEKSNVIVENFRPGVMQKLGLGYDVVSKWNPGVIYTSISGFGQTGPSNALMAYDLVVLAMSGFLSANRQPDGPPQNPNVAIADFGGGINGALAIVAAVIHWMKTGEGQQIDISMQDCMWIQVAAHWFGRYFAGGEAPPGFSNFGAPYGIYQAKDGYVSICVISNAQWKNMTKAMGRDDLTNDKTLSHLRGRQQHTNEIDEIVQGWIATKSAVEVQEILFKHDVPCGAVLNLDQLVNDPHLLSREMIMDMHQPGAGILKVVGSPLKLSKTPAKIGAPAPSLGQHNMEIFSDLLGLSAENLENLKKEGVI